MQLWIINNVDYCYSLGGKNLTHVFIQLGSQIYNLSKCYAEIRKCIYIIKIKGWNYIFSWVVVKILKKGVRWNLENSLWIVLFPKKEHLLNFEVIFA